MTPRAHRPRFGAPPHHVRRRRTAALLVLSAAALALIAHLAIGAGGQELLGKTITLPVHHNTVPGGTTVVRADAGLDAEPSGEIGEADGYVAVGGSISPFDHAPAIERLKPALRAAIQRAATDAQKDGIEMRVNSGWRSARYQQELLDRAITRYGSEQEARRYVNTPQLSTHVRGDAVDIGPTDADSWLQQHGTDYGLCQIYNNEMWHYELATEPGGTCPQQRVDASGG